jgi:hypothetical protein
MSRLVEQRLREMQDEERRLNDARVYIGRLKTQRERLTLIAELTAAVETAEADGARGSLTLAANDPPPPPPNGEKAEAFVLHKGRGVSPSTIGATIGISGRVVDQHLRVVARARGTVVRSRGKWYPAGTVPDQALTVGMLIAKVMADGATRSTAEIHEATEKLAPGTKKTSVAVEITRLVENGTLDVKGAAPNAKGFLYALKTMEAAAAAK